MESRAYRLICPKRLEPVPGAELLCIGRDGLPLEFVALYSSLRCMLNNLREYNFRADRGPKCGTFLGRRPDDHFLIVTFVENFPSNVLFSMYV